MSDEHKNALVNKIKGMRKAAGNRKKQELE